MRTRRRRRSRCGRCSSSRSAGAAVREEQYKIAVDDSYALGGSSALEVIDAQRTLLDAKTQYTTALGALNDAVADLERATGAPLDSTPPEKSHD